MKFLNYKIYFTILLYFFSAHLLSGMAYAEGSFVSDLKLGSYGEEVVLLQQILNSDPETRVSDSGSGSPQNETPFFGEKTKLAVIKFQEKYASEILAPISLTSGTGIVGPKTRTVLNRISLGGVSGAVINTEVAPTIETNNQYPTITAVIPGIISDPRNTTVTIVGENFSNQNTIFLSVQDLEIFDGYSSDGKTISVVLNTSFIDVVKNLMDSIPVEEDPSVKQSAIDALKAEFNSVGRDGVYVPATIFVKNEKGESNKFLIHLNVLKDDVSQ